MSYITYKSTYTKTGRRRGSPMTPHTELMNLRWCESRLKQMEVLGKDHWRYRHLALGISFIRADIIKHGMRQLITRERSDQLQAIADERHLEVSK